MTLIGEYLALLMIAILTLFFYEKRRILDNQTKIYWVCLGAAAVSIILNICCVDTLSIGSSVPHWLLVLMNSAYFLVSVWTCTFMAWYVFYKILEHVYERNCMYRAMLILIALNLVFLFLIIVNSKTAWIFWIDGAGGYHRGVLNKAGYGVMLLEIIAGLLCYVKNAGSVSRQVAKAIKMIIGMEMFLLLLQQMFPDVMLNGILMAFADMIFLMHFQSQKNGIDTVTGLGSRIRFLDEVSLRLGGEQQFQILLVSLKDFNLINRKYGYAWGSNVLYHVGDYLESWNVKSEVFRFSNVTFAVFCPYSSKEQADQNLESLKQRFQEEWEINNEKIRLSARFIELIHQKESWPPYEVMDYLEYMLYYGKEHDLEEVRFNLRTQQQYLRNVYLTQAIRLAVERRDFQVWYQPIYCVADGTFSCAEALVRMYTPEGEWISPSEFIPLAEGMVESVNWIVVEKVCSFLDRHRELPLRNISVNLTSEQIMGDE
ncbi:MAG: EAL domain-containing protein, partial [Blautia sp.]